MLSKSLKFIIISLALISISCQDEAVYFSKYQSFPESWPKEVPAEFSFEAPDTTEVYDVFVMLRNTQDYAYRNLFLISDINFPNGKVIVDTLEYEMAYPNGELMGQGFGLKTNKLWLKQGVKFTETGNYKVNIKHAMRAFGEINGLDSLQGITDVGLRIEKQNQENDN